jgi:2-keto-4-pentenoate hydratase/2-oxohepta-3-ene-1,7-dioic acid hydratase in catechol pathway
VQEAAKAFEMPAKSVEYFSNSLVYLHNLPASEKALRVLLKNVTEKPRNLARPAGDGHPYLYDKARVEYLPPIERPGKILCIGMNYRDHCIEQNKEIPKTPMVFNKFATSLRGHGATIPLPLKVDDHVDYEAELVVVIGKTATRVTKRTAMKHVAGYTMMNDVSLREIQKNERQWSRAKGWDGSGPCGPVIVTADEIPNPHDLGISCLVNGKVMQNSNTSQLIFDIPTLISFITQLVTLEPGDMISTGTPGGVGAYRTPTAFLREGDKVEVRIDRIGSLINTCGVR